MSRKYILLLLATAVIWLTGCAAAQNPADGTDHSETKGDEMGDSAASVRDVSSVSEEYRDIFEQRAECTLARHNTMCNEASFTGFYQPCFTGYEVLTFRQEDSFSCNDADYEVYHWEIVFHTDDPDADQAMWGGSPFVDEQNRVHYYDQFVYFVVCRENGQVKWDFFHYDLYSDPREQVMDLLADHFASLSPMEGTPLTAEELAYFQEYTSSKRIEAAEESEGDIGYATEISCFFTSHYRDPRDMDAEEFLRYCPDEYMLTVGDEDEFRLVQEKLDWRVGEDDHLASLDEMDVPCHRYSREYLNGILMRYAGITVEDMHTDWTEELLYIPETDCFYNFTSDFGPGIFTPFYGVKNGDIVILRSNGGNAAVLTLQKSGENWCILSHQ